MSVSQITFLVRDPYEGRRLQVKPPPNGRESWPGKARKSKRQSSSGTLGRTNGSGTIDINLSSRRQTEPFFNGVPALEEAISPPKEVDKIFSHPAKVKEVVIPSEEVDEIVSPPQELHNEDRLCADCSETNIFEIFQEPVQGPHNQQYSWDRVTVENERRCPFCRLLLKTIQESNDLVEASAGRIYGRFVRFARDEAAKSYYLKFVVSLAPLPDDESRLPKMFSYCIIPTVENKTCQSHRDGLFRARHLNPHQINMDLVSRWLSLCKECHDGCKPNALDTLPSFRFRVVDVLKGCVVDAPPDCEYVALSYVWGNVNQLRLTSNTLHALSQDGALHGRFQAATTIQDAIELCRSMGIQYLWVDSLCILQEDLDEKNCSIMHMNTVYGCATLTIIAASGSNANAGLPGVRHGARNSIQHFESVDGLNLASTLQFPTWCAELSHWNSRGWTLQESTLSKRLLVFTTHQVYFRCQKARWREDIALESWSTEAHSSNDGLIEWSSLDRTISKTQMNSYHEVAFQAFYMPLSAQFIRRQLTNDRDAVFAFEGILKALSPVIGRSRWGLPENHFAMALLWQTDDSFPRPRRQAFPTWCWAGWKHHGHTLLKYPVYMRQDVGSPLVCFQIDNNQQLDQFTAGTMKLEQLPRDIRNHLEPGDVSEILERTEYCYKPLERLLFFWTSSASLAVDRQGYLPPTLSDQWKDHAYFPVRLDYGTCIGEVFLKRDWRERQPRNLEFILIGFTQSLMVFPLLISWGKGLRPLAQRVQCLIQTTADNTKHYPFLGVDVWLRAKPRRKLIVLE